MTEFTSSELRALIRDSENRFYNDRQLRTLQFQIHLRGALSALPIACAFLAVSLGLLIGRRFIGALVGVFVCYGIYSALYAGRSAADSGLVSPAAGAWTPILAAVLLAFIAVGIGVRRAKRVSVASSTM